MAVSDSALGGKIRLPMHFFDRYTITVKENNNSQGKQYQSIFGLIFDSLNYKSKYVPFYICIAGVLKIKKQICLIKEIEMLFH